jgi:hypothetical protein
MILTRYYKLIYSQELSDLQKKNFVLILNRYIAHKIAASFFPFFLIKGWLALSNETFSLYPLNYME